MSRIRSPGNSYYPAFGFAWRCVSSAVGYYTLISMTINVFEIGIPEDGTAELTQRQANPKAG